MIFIFNILRKNWISFHKLHCVNLIILWKIKIDITCDGVPIWGISSNPILICKFINNLIFKLFIYLFLCEILRGYIGLFIFFFLRSLLYQIILSLLLFLLLFLFFILIFQLSNLVSVFFRKFMILSHYIIHIVLIYLLDIYVFPLF